MPFHTKSSMNTVNEHENIADECYSHFALPLSRYYAKDFKEHFLMLIRVFNLGFLFYFHRILFECLVMFITHPETWIFLKQK